MFSHKANSVVESVELPNVSRLMTDNRLSLHLGKTESILFRSKIEMKRSPGFNVVAGDILLVAKESVNHLGWVLDSHMSGMSQAKKVLTNVNQRTCFLARIYKFLDRKAMETLVVQ